MNPDPPSLVSLARQQCLKYSSFITDIGETPFRVAEPILAKLSVEQLTAIEQNVPQILEQSDKLWREHILRDFPHRKPRNGQYRETYKKFKIDKEMQLGAARERLKLNQQQYKLNRQATSVVALTERELPIAQRGPPQTAFKSRSMQSVAKKAHSTRVMRNSKPLTKFATIESLNAKPVPLTTSLKPSKPITTSHPLPASAPVIRRKRVSPLFHPKR